MEDKKLPYFAENGKLKIEDADFFLKMLAPVHADKHNITQSEVIEAYNTLKNHAKSLIKKVAQEINMQVPPRSEWDSICGEAIAQLLRDIDLDNKASITTYLYNKLKYAIKVYNREIGGFYSAKGAHKDWQEQQGLSVHSFKDDDGVLRVDVVDDNEDVEKLVITQDFRHRQFIAFRIALAGLPRMQQIVLYATAVGEENNSIADMVGMDVKTMALLRDQGMALLFQRAMRSSHLTEDEKIDTLKLHGIVAPNYSGDLQSLLCQSMATK
ncbi:hypothetical protein ACHJH3_06470 [Campylobacter sp. MOP7]|uniref:hypothetical protein n=1 Tax=Campylobacter canis TaxID=3378588 RepID=UPI00387E8F02